MPRAIGDYKICSACRENKHVSEFRKNRAHYDGFANQCKLCLNASNEKFLAKQNPDYMVKIRRRYTLKRKYDLTVAEYEAMVEAAGGVCEVCGSPPGRENLDVDHCHQTGKVRGVLCYNCNRAMGFVNDNPKILRALADYLDEHLARDIIPDREYFY